MRPGIAAGLLVVTLAACSLDFDRLRAAPGDLDAASPMDGGSPSDGGSADAPPLRDGEIPRSCEGTLGSLAGVTAGRAHTCAWSEEGQAYCWGRNANGQAGVGTFATLLVRPTPVGEGLTAWQWIDAGEDHTCGVPSGEPPADVRCWGRAADGRLGVGSLGGADLATPTPVDDPGDWRSVAAGSQHSCGLRVRSFADPSLDVWCWGHGANGELGTGDANSQDGPTQSMALRFRDVAAGQGVTCGIDVTGAVQCWGRDDQGQLGTGGGPSQSSPVRLGFPDELAASAVTVGGGHACIVDGDTGDLHCWGSNADGRVGAGSIGEIMRPTRLASVSGFSDVSAGDRHVCAVRTGGELYCWGSNRARQLAQDGFVDVLSAPTPVPGSWRSVAAGGSHTCAIAADRTLWCWGANDAGQLGIGQIGPARGVPVQVCAPAS